MINKTVETKIGRIDYSICGEGTPVLFVHGGHSNSKEVLAHKGFDLGKYRLLTPSRPGYGQTPLMAEVSPAATAALFVSLLDLLQIQQVVLIGISAGGPAALELAATFPERVSRLVLISAVTKKWLSATDPNYIKGKKLFNPAVEKYSWTLFKLFYALLPGLMAKMMLKELSTARGAITKKERKELHEMILQQRSFYGFTHDLDQQIKTEVLARVKCPTLLIHSNNDLSVKKEHAYFASTHIQDSVLKTYDNKWGHLIWIGEESEKPINDIMKFIEHSSGK